MSNEELDSISYTIRPVWSKPEFKETRGKAREAFPFKPLSVKEIRFDFREGPHENLKSYISLENPTTSSSKFSTVLDLLGVIQRGSNSPIEPELIQETEIVETSDTEIVSITKRPKRRE